MKKLVLLYISIFSLLYSVTVSIPDKKSYPTTEIEIPIEIDNGEGIAGFNFKVSFNSNILQPIGYIPGELTSNWTFSTNIENSGYFIVAGIMPQNGQPLSAGSGSLVKMKFNVIGNIGQSTSLNFEVSKLGDLNGNYINHNTQSGTFNIIGYTISGKVTLIGGSGSITNVVLNLTGTTSKTTNPDINGDYSFGDLEQGNYTITPSFSGYVFNPTSLSYINLNSDINNANFEGKAQYTLTVNSQYGNPNPSGTRTYLHGDQITATVESMISGTPGTRYVCTGWTGTGSVPSTGSSNSVTFTITQNSTLTWNWKKQYQLMKISNPSEGGMIISTNNQDWYDENSTVNINAVPNNGWAFSYWSGDLQGSTNPTNINMNGPKNVIANFIKKDFSLTINPNLIDDILLEGVNISKFTNVSVSPIAGFSSPVNLNASIQPQTNLIIYSFENPTLTPPSSTRLNLTISPETKPDTYIITIDGNGGGVSHSENLTVVVNTKVYLPNADAVSPSKIDIPVMVTNSKGIASFKFRISFNKDVINFDRVKSGSLTDTWDLSANLINNNLVEVTGNSQNELSGNEGSLCILTFNVIGSLNQTSDNSFTSSEIKNKNNILIPNKTFAGILTVNRLKGDINNDATIDISDVILAMRIVVEFDPFNSIADMNNDGIVDILDVILILRKTIGLP